MLHITENIYLDVDQYCFVLQEQYIVPEINEKTGKPNKNAGEIRYINPTYHPTHKDVVNKLITKGFRFAVEGDTEKFLRMMAEIEQKFDDILKLKRY